MGGYLTHLLLKRGLKLDIGVVIEIRRRVIGIVIAKFYGYPTLLFIYLKVTIISIESDF